MLGTGQKVCGGVVVVVVGGGWWMLTPIIVLSLAQAEQLQKQIFFIQLQYNVM